MIHQDQCHRTTYNARAETEGARVSVSAIFGKNVMHITYTRVKHPKVHRPKVIILEYFT